MGIMVHSLLWVMQDLYHQTAMATVLKGGCASDIQVAEAQDDVYDKVCISVAPWNAVTKPYKP